MVKQGRVITTDFKLVKVNPIAFDEDGFPQLAVDENGILYVLGTTAYFLPNERTHIIGGQCWDESVSDIDFINITLNDFPEALEKCMLDYFK